MKAEIDAEKWNVSMFPILECQDHFFPIPFADIIQIFKMISSTETYKNWAEQIAKTIEKKNLMKSIPQKR